MKKRERTRAFDPIDLEILWNRLVLVVGRASVRGVLLALTTILPPRRPPETG